MKGSVPNVKKAKAIHEQRQAAMKRGTVATQLQENINKAYRGAKPRGR
jgi:hypothetical protein